MGGIALYILGIVMGLSVDPWWFLLCSIFIAVNVLAEYGAAKKAL